MALLKAWFTDGFIYHRSYFASVGERFYCVSGLHFIFSAAFGAGGGLMLLVVMASFMPMTLVVPVHGLVQLGSNTNRLLLSFKHIDKRMFIYFTLGGSAGAILSSFVIVDIQLDAMKLIAGLFVIYLLWGKSPLRYKAVRSCGVFFRLCYHVYFYVCWGKWPTRWKLLAHEQLQ
ncbi:sulfite exporter TauE/SafE family protein [Pseudoalteromonas sp. B62]|uniref:sulfite exporter TauE/SafE family protein n=1 Tax=Pseudoalteromonas sp. B62 TaxID=630483 RepID=UPI003FA6EDE2